MSTITSFQEYLQYEKKYSVHTVTAYCNDLLSFQQFLVANYETDEIETVNYSLIRSWIVFMVDQGISNNSVNRKISS